jgi:hypothetical protein
MLIEKVSIFYIFYTRIKIDALEIYNSNIKTQKLAVAD